MAAESSLDVLKDGKRFRFAVSNELTRWRARTLFTKEPETIAWIDSFGNDDVFYDIGANVGVFTVYAAVAKKRLKVMAFEPTFFNYGILNKNILLNGLHGRVISLGLAFSQEDALDFIYIPSTEDGRAFVNFGAPGSRKCVFRQGAVAYALDNFIKKFNPPFPNHIKIDVDGLESRIVKGGRRTLRDPRVKSLSIEWDEASPDAAALCRLIESCGLKPQRKKRPATVAASRKFYNRVFVRR